MGVPPFKDSVNVHEIWMLVDDSDVSVGVFGLLGVVAGIISKWLDGAPKPITFLATTLNLYLRPVTRPELK